MNSFQLIRNLHFHDQLYTKKMLPSDISFPTCSKIPPYVQCGTLKFKSPKKVGKGKSGVVYKYKNQKNKFVLKVFKKGKEIQKDKVIKKLQSLGQENYCNVIPVKTVKNKNWVYTVMPSLQKFKAPLSQKEAYSVWKSIIKQMDCLMKYGMYYYDLKIDNTLQKKGKYYRIDLGSVYFKGDKDDPVSSFNIYTPENGWKHMSHTTHVQNMKFLSILYFLDLLGYKELVDFIDMTAESLFETDESEFLEECQYVMSDAIQAIEPKIKKKIAEALHKYVKKDIPLCV